MSALSDSPNPARVIPLAAVDITPNQSEPEQLVAATFGSESDDSEFRSRAQEDASILYARPPVRGKTRTYSESGGSQAVYKQRNTYQQVNSMATRSRRMSHGLSHSPSSESVHKLKTTSVSPDENPIKPRKFLVDVEETASCVVSGRGSTQLTFAFHYR
ncbi:hypothetical protein P7C70_g6342, partial [Phenoliferia sp. Uapishka_3]